MGDSPFLLIPMHKGDDMFMSEKQFEKFYWPTYERMLNALVQEGSRSFADNRRHLYPAAGTPPGPARTGVLWTFEKTDMALAKKVLGAHTCIAGNVTSAMMCTTGRTISKVLPLAVRYLRPRRRLHPLSGIFPGR
jgi:uroporphyrinogen-III decarboxylase